MSITVAAFYKFVSIEDSQELRSGLAAICCQNEIKGTILLAGEGINATVSGAAESIAALLDYVRGDDRFADLNVKLSQHASHPFRRMKVKIKPEIVTFGMPDLKPASRTGTYVDAARWNDVLDEAGMTVIDTRNDYEIATGTFADAINPSTRTFSEFAQFAQSQLDPKRQPKVAMFCTGGIRCEKASAYLLSLGFETVYHLEGGILKYLETVPSGESRWKGDCFVFDERGALDHDLSASAPPLPTERGERRSPADGDTSGTCTPLPGCFTSVRETGS